MKGGVLVLLAAVMLAAAAVGSSGVITPFGGADAQDLFWSLRMPRVVFAAFAGGMLGLSGAVYQLVLKNPLADSFTTGAASSAALGAVLALGIGVPAHLVSPFALVTGLGGLLLVYRLSVSWEGISPVTMILAGVVVNIVASAVISFTKYFFDDSITSIVFWLMGGFFSVSAGKLIVAGCALGFGALAVWRMAPSVTMLALDEHSAATSGVDVGRVRLQAFVVATLLVAVTVSYTGLIGFVGLVVPHVARSFFGSAMGVNGYYSTVFGAVLLVAADAVSRVIIPGGAELPVGIVTAVIGGGFFLFILQKRRSQVWHD